MPLPARHPYRFASPASGNRNIIIPGTSASCTLSALSGSSGTISWAQATNAAGYYWYVGTAAGSGQVVTGTVTSGNTLTATATYAFTASTNYYGWVIPYSSTGTNGATTISAAASYSSGGGITVVGTNTAANMSGAANGVGGFSGVDDGGGAMNTNITLFGNNYTTMYLGTNGYITPGFTQAYSTNPSASFPGSIAIHIRPYDARGINASWSQGYSSVTTSAQYTRIVGDWYPYYGINSGDIQAEIYLVRDVTNSKQFIWIKIGSGYNNVGYGNTYWGITNGSSHVTGTSFPGNGGSVVFSSDLNGNTWTTTLPGSLSGF